MAWLEMGVGPHLEKEKNSQILINKCHCFVVYIMVITNIKAYRKHLKKKRVWLKYIFKIGNNPL